LFALSDDVTEWADCGQKSPRRVVNEIAEYNWRKPKTGMPAHWPSALMKRFEHKRRSFLFTAHNAERTSDFAEGSIAGRGTIPSSALAIGHGEHLLHFRDEGNVFIKLGSDTGSQNLALGTQQVIAGTGIPVHRHFNMDEVFYVLEGRGTVILNDVRYVFEKGAAVFISRNTWHAFENPEHELLLLWVVTPAGLDGFFRETCNAPGAPRKQLSPERIKEIALNKYGTEYR